mmetsp:Transcript_18010/g.26768  ORF Transcript_18010/g.26768 Transcript_18010/m.26768 type:complete len:416 (-) Transcript_18010:37-1284(-)
MSLSELLKDLQADINAAIKLENKLKDKKFIDDIKTVLKIAKIGFIDAAGNALHRIHKTKPTIDAVKELIQGFPDALSFKNKKNRLPIQSAVRSNVATKYVPILAKEGIKHEVGGRGMRGGLLVVDPTDVDGMNTLQLIVNLGNPSDPIPHDTARLKVLKELRKDNLLLKKDIKEHNLLFWSCQTQSKRRFEYLAEWDPDCLMTGTYKDLPLSHAIIQHRKDLTFFTMYFQTALKHYPQHLGFLFQKDNSGKTAYERAVEKHGKQETFKTIQQCIPTDTSLPILHHVMKDAPQYFDEFSIRYLSALHLLDQNGRSFIQAQLAGGAKTLVNDGFYFLRLSDDEIAEADPVTKQYPFLTAASGESGDLSTTYFLLSKNPSLLERYKEEATQQVLEEQEAKMTMKRKRGDGDGDNEEGE